MFIDVLNKILLIFILLAPNVYLLLVFIRFKKSLKEIIFPIILLTTLIIILFNKLLFRGQTLSAQDFNNIQIPFFHFFRESIIKYGEPPLWNSRFGGGFDAFSNPISPYFSPLNFVFLLNRDVYSSANIFIFFQLFLTAVFTLLLFKKLKFNNFVSIFGAVVFTFNGFVTMRLSPGVGIEYLYSYKWIPLILLYTLLYLENNKFIDLVCISLSLAFTFEGNLNIAIAIWMFWGLFTLIMAKKSLIKELKKLIFVPIIAFSIYAIKMLPFLDLMSHSSGRISAVVGGWRINKIDMIDFWKYFPPFWQIFGSAVFTPGIIASIFTLICVLLILFSLIKKRSVDRILKFSLISIVVGFLFTTYNPISNLFFSLPFFNRVTIIPAFMVFVFVPAYLMSVYGLDKVFYYISKLIKYERWDTIKKFGILGISCLVFLEILLGPSTFGNNTYSFNFSKMNRNEVFRVPPYSVIKDIKPGVFMFTDSSDIFVYPYAVSVMNLYTLNSFKYFYSPDGNNNLLKQGSLNDIKNRVDYIVSTKEINDEGLVLLKSVGTGGIFENFKSHSILDKKYNYLDLQAKNGWNEIIFIYENKSDLQKNIFYKRTDNHPISMYFENPKMYLQNGEIRTSVKYSKWWGVISSDKLKISEDDYGYLKISGDITNQPFNLYYLNPFIYIGMTISICSFGLVLYHTFLNRKLGSYRD